MIKIESKKLLNIMNKSNLWQCLFFFTICIFGVAQTSDIIMMFMYVAFSFLFGIIYLFFFSMTSSNDYSIEENCSVIITQFYLQILLIAIVCFIIIVYD